MKRILVVSLVLFCGTLRAQNLSLTLFAGVSNYQGDLQEKRITVNQAGYAAGAGVLYELNNKIALRGNVTFGKIGAADSKGSKNVTRNLSFSSPLTDVHVGIEYSFLDIYQKGFTPYVFAGVSYFHFNPSTLDSTGQKVLLQPLGTEGQGFYDNRKKYNLNQFAIPFGAGVKLALGDNLRLGLELGMRKTNTDYLDDVSATYADKDLLQQNNGVEAVALAYRGDELKGNAGVYPVAGAQRGSAKYKDWYYFTGVSLSFRLKGIYGSNSKLGCPVNVY